jgi:hypothetical protein
MLAYLSLSYQWPCASALIADLALWARGAVVLLTKLRDPSAVVAARVLAAVGELALVAGADLTPAMDQLLPMIIEALQVCCGAPPPPDHQRRRCACACVCDCTRLCGRLCYPSLSHTNMPKQGSVVRLTRHFDQHTELRTRPTRSLHRGTQPSVRSLDVYGASGCDRTKARR